MVRHCIPLQIGFAQNDVFAVSQTEQTRTKMEQQKKITDKHFCSEVTERPRVISYRSSELFAGICEIFGSAASDQLCKILIPHKLELFSTNEQ